MDPSFGMLAWDAAVRPPGAVADIRALPLAAQSVEDAVAAFVLNHLTDPSAGLAELARVTRSGGARAGRRFSTTSGDPRGTGLTPSPRTPAGRSQPGTPSSRPPAAPILGSVTAMAAAARPAVFQVGTTADRRASRGR
jgi:Methyltransferase domain